MDRLLLEGMTFFGRHGVLPAERELGARFRVDVHPAWQVGKERRQRARQVQIGHQSIWATSTEEIAGR